MIKYVKGNVLKSGCNIIMHGVNCQNGFGSGVALAIAKQYPKAKHYYHEKFAETGWKLGDVQIVPQWDGVLIANCATQDHYLPRGVCHFDYDAMKKCMEDVLDFAEYEHATIAMPKIGSHLAGGDWDRIEKIINNVVGDTEVLVYVL